MLGKLPLDPEVVRHGDSGRAMGIVENETPFARAFEKIVEEVIARTNRTGEKTLEAVPG